MKRICISSVLLFQGLLLFFQSNAQCAMCTKTAQQLGEKPAEGMNSGIIYLMLMPFAVIGFIAYRWWKQNKESESAN